MSNPFDDPNGTFLVLVNEENQHSLWPEFVPVPGGWRVAHPADSRDACLAFIEENWTDMRPASLARTMDQPAGAPQPQ
ncbi:MbtH family protein [Streptomyces hygroscopicus]|uniref:MbtH family protein n=1 Tax=Streptomyces hygroscopicus TaxID=1912 RepID=UPI000785B3F6|nr:MbtH family protein [Streptomyces hygroscopicus]